MSRSTNGKKHPLTKEEVAGWTPPPPVKMGKQDGFHPRTPRQQNAWRALHEDELVFLIGPAGTGKTHLAAAIVAERWKTKAIEKIVVSRPAIEQGDSVGFLPGTLEDKMEFFLRPFFENLAKHLGGPHVVRDLRAKGAIEILSMTYLKGRTFDRAAVVYDEMQNATKDQMMCALTRAGEGSHMIVTMDPVQCDIHPDESAYLDVRRFLGLVGVSIHEFELEDVVRSRIVKTVLTAYT